MTKLLLLLFPLILCAELTLEQLQNSPSGHVRNFQIWQYMKTEINASAADAAYDLVQGHNEKIFTQYAKKTDNPAVKEQYKCSRLDTQELLREKNASCINLGLSLADAIDLSQIHRKKISLSLAKEDALKSKLISLMNSDSFAADLFESGAKNYLHLYNSIDYDKRHKFFNIRLPKKKINRLAEEKAFAKAVKYTVTDSSMYRMQESLLDLEPHDLTAESYFFLALNALRFKATKKAMFYLEIAQKKSYFQIDKDKALFWRHLISDDFYLLKELSQSSDINMYTLYANEKLGRDVQNYFTTLPLKDSPSNINIRDPYAWEHVLAEIRAADGEEKLKTLLEKYSSKDDDVLHAFIYAKVQKYKKHSYIMPYQESTASLNNDTKALIYALARQESHFIPSAISRSFALGVMQIMPFLIEALAKQKKETAALEEMFDPDKNIKYATKHLSYLKKHLYHPLFIAYAYNGGIGFTKKHLLKGTFKEGSYEPYLSMELMANRESREYGKKVLANYVIYKKILNEEVKITSLFESLTEPSRTDRFRRRDL